MEYAAIHIPEFPVVAWLRSDPAARSHALAVTEGTAPLQCVVSINRAAKSQGVSRGMSKVQAEATGPLLINQPQSLQLQREHLPMHRMGISCQRFN